ncbi:cysteine proteinases superfamily protein [Artemisia annua]|uniref:Cysteine proteinases superfamily protein n=1 Tax=Artemisia annua TaxID=35608 RepID=A0A2U1P7J8_ARTAN|nr:cysteine proteinases superfamily protein [Artemisia annua]
MCEPDSDVVRWGLNFLDVDQIFSSTYYGDSNQHDVTICHEQYDGGSYEENEYNDVKNDEMLAHSLQQELLDLSIEDDHEVSNPVEHLETSNDTRDWYGQPSDNYYYGDDSRLQETDEMGQSSSCSSPETRSYDGDEYSYNLEITDESELDGEVGKRLTEIIPVPHIPKVNGDIPSVDEATTDHQRLLDRLQVYNLIESKVQGDGNCQFRALSDQFYRSPEHHKFVRRQVYNQIFICENIEGFLLVSHIIHLSFWAEVHYNSIYPEGDLPPPEYRKKRRWWNFKHRHQAYLD